MNNENITSKLEYQNNLMTKGPMPHKMHYNLHIIADFSKENTQEHLGAPSPDITTIPMHADSDRWL